MFKQNSFTLREGDVGFVVKAVDFTNELVNIEFAFS